jgi:DNA polymerase-1
VADENKLLMKFDKKQAEWVAMAYITGDENMIKAVEGGIDVHTYTASSMFKVPPDVIKKEHKILDTESDPERIAELRRGMDFMQPYLGQWLPRTMSMRQCGKKSNHGLNYDEHAKMFALINEISEKEAQTIIDFYHHIYPGIGRYYENIRNRLSTNQRSLENLFGRKYRFLEKWGPDLFKSAYSFIPQSTVGELVNRAMDRIYDDNSPETAELEILMQTHDDIKFQDQYQDLDKLVKCIRKIRQYMDIPLVANGREFTIGTDMKIGFSFGKMTEIDIDQSDDEVKAAIQRFIDEQQKQQAATV